MVQSGQMIHMTLYQSEIVSNISTFNASVQIVRIVQIYEYPISPEQSTI